MAISTAVDVTRVSRVVGYKVYPDNFQVNTPYLPQRIIVLGEANDANQSGLDTEPYEFISAKEVGDKFGFGSPLYMMARILRPLSGNPIGGIPTIAIAQASDVAATQAVYELGVTVATTVTKNATHTLIVNGRTEIDGQSYSFSVVKGQSASDVIASIISAVNNVIGSPVTASNGTTQVDLTSKWGGATAILSVSVETYGETAGVVYAEVDNTDGTGAVALTNALADFGENWNTLVINPYGSTFFTTLEDANGVPDPTNPSGKYTPTAFRPFMSFSGLTESDKDDVVTITNASARQSQVTNVMCPAPASLGFVFEAAANVVRLVAPIAQNSPHLDSSGKQYPDMPIPSDGDIGDFSDYDARDYMVKRGSSTVSLKNGKYTIEDLVTTYAPAGEVTPKFRFVRDLIVDWNVAYNKILLMLDIQDKTIVPDNTPSAVAGVVKPKTIKQDFADLYENLAALALIADPDFSIENLVVGINGTNPARIDIASKYKRTSVAHIVSTDAAVDFNYSA